MKKMLFALLAVAFSSSVYGWGYATMYEVTGSKVRKVEIVTDYSTGATVKGADAIIDLFEVSDNVYMKIGKFENGKSIQHIEYSNSITKNVKRVKRPRGVPSNYSCYQLASGQGKIYCVTPTFNYSY